MSEYTSSYNIDYDTYASIINQFYMKSRQQALLDIENELNNDHDHKPKLKALKSGLKAVNFVYGEIDINSFFHLLNKVGINDENETYIDLGCGSGVTLIAASLMIYYNKKYNKVIKFKNIIGIDLLSMKIEECRKTLTYIDSNINDFHNKGVEYYEYLIQKKPEINVILQNFLQYDWTTADVVYACATCFALDLLDQLEVKLKELKVGSRIILLDSLILQSQDNIFQLMDTYSCKTTWGIGIAYTYIKIA